MGARLDITLFNQRKKLALLVFPKSKNFLTPPSEHIVVSTKRELQSRHSCMALGLKVFSACGTLFDSRSLSTNLGLYQRGATRQADEFDTQSQVLAACGETWTP